MAKKPRSQKPRPSPEQKAIEKARSSYPLPELKPLNKNQAKVVRDFYLKNLLMLGSAGTGKSYLATALSLQEIFGTGNFERFIIVRSGVETRELGFLPGNLEEKISVYEEPYIKILTKLTGDKNSYDQLKRSGVIEFISTSFLRGLTFDNSIIFVDEIANMTLHELSSIVTRFGKNCKLILAGDVNQCDLEMRGEKTGIYDFTKIIKTMSDDFSVVTFTVDDIVRSGLVRNYLIAKENLETDGII